MPRAHREHGGGVGGPAVVVRQVNVLAVAEGPCETHGSKGAEAEGQCVAAVGEQDERAPGGAEGESGATRERCDVHGAAVRAGLRLGGDTARHGVEFSQSNPLRQHTPGSTAEVYHADEAAAEGSREVFGVECAAPGRRSRRHRRIREREARGVRAAGHCAASPPRRRRTACCDMPCLYLRGGRRLRCPRANGKGGRRRICGESPSSR